MKKLLIVAFLAFITWGIAQTVMTQGQKNVASSWIYWGAGAGDGIVDTLNDSMTAIYRRDDTVWYDSAAGGTWVQLSGTVDSCSYPFWLTTTGGSAHPERLQYLSVLLKSTRTDSNDMIFNIETREQYTRCYKAGACSTSSAGNQYGHYVTAWSGWTPENNELSDANVTVTDSVRTALIDRTANTKVRQKLRFNVSGEQARLCPDWPTTFKDSVVDTLTIDSIWYKGF